MAITQTIPNTQVNGQGTFPLTPTAQTWTSAELRIDRTVNGGLNSLTTADTLALDFDYSTDGGATWTPFAGIVCEGGPHVTKGVTLAEDGLTISSGVQPFPSGTGFRVRYDASTRVRLAGTVTYS